MNLRSEDQRSEAQSLSSDQDVTHDWAASLPHFAQARETLPKPRRFRLKLRWIFLLLAFCAMSGLCVMALTGRGVSLPQWALERIETRLNTLLAESHLPQGNQLSIGGLDFALDRDFAPRLVMRNLQLEQSDGAAAIALPQTELTLSGSALFKAQLRPKTLVLRGAKLSLTRDKSGQLRLDLGGLSGEGQVQTLAELLDSLDKMFSAESFSELRIIEGQALALTLNDERAGRSWEVGDGRLMVQNSAEGLGFDLGMTLLDGAHIAQASLGAMTSKQDSSARLWANVDQIAAEDLAAQAAPFAILSMVNAPISGRINASLDAQGVLGGFEGNLTLGAGQVEAVGGGRSIDFEQGEVALRYDIEKQRVYLDRLSVQSPSLRLQAQGWGDLLDQSGALAQAGQMPQQIVSQLQFSQVMVDPEGLFVEPVEFSSGLANFRIALEPFRVDIGEVILRDGEDFVNLSGYLGQAQPEGWEGALDVHLNRISSDRLIRLWPLIAVPKTRKWLSENVGQGELTQVNAALRILPGREPRFALDYEFSGAEVRFLKTLPPITEGSGHASILGNVYTIVVDKGHVTAPLGGDITVDGSMFQVLDITQKPAQAEVTLHSSSELVAALSLLDQDPFKFLTKAKLPVELGSGRAELKTVLRLPLIAKVKTTDVSYSVEGKLFDVQSDQIIKGRQLAAKVLNIEVNPRQLTLSGQAQLDGVRFDGKFEQSLVKGDKGRAKVSGAAILNDEALRRFGVNLPRGWIAGSAAANIIVELQQGMVPKLNLTSAMQGLEVKLPLGWAKAAQSSGRLAVDVTLSPNPEVTKIELETAGLSAAGRATTRKAYGLERLDVSYLRIGDWLDVPLEILGQGQGKEPKIKVLGGKVDLRYLPKGGAVGSGQGGQMGPIEVVLDRLQVTKGVAMTRLRGTVTPSQGGLSGRFSAGLNGTGQISGAMEPRKGGTAVQIWSEDAGSVMAAAGLFNKGRGGRLNMTIEPAGSGTYLGNASFTDLSVLNAPILAGMLSAASVIGLLDQLQGQGIYFSEGDMAFRIRPEGIEIIQGAAHGASMGISFAGLYRQRDNHLDIQGTISPIYLLNGIGQIFGNKGEGLFGFNYRLSGSAAKPSVFVNPLSILTPGRFREIFRRAPPVLEGSG